ncbi:copper chaperone PCu(A)C [Neptuniibacter sp. PT8_73]|uniref:copper chaperone PCu(A)C n=1 Tax=unclassified Neptuniibacter TaxID=2630693 RepID=UPI0039F69976
MNKKTLLNTCLATVLSLSSFSAMAEIITSDAYVRALIPGSGHTAAFLNITNRNRSDVYLTSAKTASAKRTELHNHITEDGVMMMRQVERIQIPSTQTVALKPGGYHLMLMKLDKSLNVGNTVDIELTFSNGEKINVSAPIKNVIETNHHHH